MSTPIGKMEAAVRAVAAKKFASGVTGALAGLEGLVKQLPPKEQNVTVHDLPTVVGADGNPAIDFAVLINRLHQTLAGSSLATKSGDAAVDQFVGAVQKQEWGAAGALLK